MFSVYAATLPLDTDSGVVTIKSFETLFANLIGVAVAIAGIALFIMLLTGGFNLLTAGADAGKAQSAQKTITWAIGGLVFIVLSFLILRLIASFTGVEGILNFQVTS